MTAVAILNRDHIIQSLATGARLSDIAPALNVGPTAISNALKSDPEYRAAIEVGFHHRLDKAEDEIENAADSVDVARARARFQSVAWRAEREFSQTWGRQDQLIVTGKVEIDASSVLEASRRIAFALSLAAQTAVPPLPEPSRVLDHVPGNGTVSTEPI